MSLVNDMLRDLDQRWPGHDTLDSEQGELPQAANPANAQLTRRSLPPGLGWVVSLFIVLGLGVVFWPGGETETAVPVVKHQASESAQNEPVGAHLLATVNESNVILPTITEATFAKSEQSELAANALHLPIAEKLIDPQRQIIEELLESGARALLMDRLTSPAHDNAYDYFTRVLKLEPDNQTANSGLQQIGERYLVLMNSAYAQGDRNKAERLRRKAIAVGASVAEAAPASAPGTGEESILTLGAVTTSPATASSASLQKSFASRDRETVGRAEELLKEQGRQAAVNLLQQFVAQYPHSIEASARLAQMYLDGADLNRAEELLASLGHLPAQQYAYLHSQLFTARKQYATALSQLQQYRPGLSEHPRYYALEAALLHKAKRYHESADAYKQLLALDADNGAYWLGLAAALDASASPGALEAFRQAKHYAQQGAGYLSYVSSRINDLSTRP